MAESLIKLLTDGGIPAMFALLLVYTLHASTKREERLLSKLDEHATILGKITMQLEALSREIERMQEGK
jgi:hypothetical protein